MSTQSIRKHITSEGAIVAFAYTASDGRFYFSWGKVSDLHWHGSDRSFDSMVAAESAVDERVLAEVEHDCSKCVQWLQFAN